MPWTYVMNDAGLPEGTIASVYDLADGATHAHHAGARRRRGERLSVCQIGNHVVEGYRPDRYAELLGVAGVTRTPKRRKIGICNTGASLHAIARRCGQMNAPLDRGTLAGAIVTCPMHCAQFDVTTGDALAGPIPAYAGDEPPPVESRRCCGTWRASCSRYGPYRLPPTV